MADNNLTLTVTIDMGAIDNEDLFVRTLNAEVSDATKGALDRYRAFKGLPVSRAQDA